MEASLLGVGSREDSVLPFWGFDIGPIVDLLGRDRGGGVLVFGGRGMEVGVGR